MPFHKIEFNFKGLSIFNLARAVACCFDPMSKIQFESYEKELHAEDYVPCVNWAPKEFNLPKPISLQDSILKTKMWALDCSKASKFY